MITRLSLETSVINTVEKVLGLSDHKVTLNDDLINLGPNSLKLAQLAAALQTSYPGVKVTVQDVFRCRTAGALVDLIRRQGIG